MNETDLQAEVRRLTAIATLLTEQKQLLSLKVQTLVVQRRLMDIEGELRALGPIIRDPQK